MTLKKSPAPTGHMLSFDSTTMAAGPLYRLLIGAIVPRPIAFISTVSPDGVVNAAPFSFFNGISSSPPALMFSVSRKSNGDKKDTLINIEKTKQFVVNTVSEWMVEPMHQASADYPYGVSELEKVGLTVLPSTKVAPPRIKESAVQMECELLNSLEVGAAEAGGATVIIGKILAIHVAQDVYDTTTGQIDSHKLMPVARLGAAGYGLIGQTFDLPRVRL